MVVGTVNYVAPSTDVEQGAVYVFTAPASGWAHAKQVAVLKAPRGQSEEEFGRSVAISGNTIVVGAPFREVGNHTGQGEAYVFVKPASGWKSVAPTAELTARRGAAHEYFGESVAISGHTVLVGAPGRRVGRHTAQGAVDVFAVPARATGRRREAAGRSSPHPTGRPTTPWASPSPSPAGRSSPGPISTGSARPRTRALSTSSRSAPRAGGALARPLQLSNERGESGELFGRIVAISQNTVVVGAPDRRGENPEQGAAYVFVKPSHGWAGSLTQTAELTASDPGRSDQFGGALAISGGLIVAGAAGHTLGENTEQGAGYVFVEPATGWVTATESSELTAASGAAGDRLGLSVAISGDTLLVGAPGRAVHGERAQGAVYAFRSTP